MIVGGNKKGKTSLKRRLCKDPRILNKDGTRVPTVLDEISISNWEYPSDNPATAVHFKIWDFPSQVLIDSITMLIVFYVFVITHRVTATL